MKCFDSRPNAPIAPCDTSIPTQPPTPHGLMAHDPSIQFRRLIGFVLRERQRQSVDTRLKARKAPVRLGLQIREHLPIVSFDPNENFIDSRKHSLDNVDHLAPPRVEFAAQLLYIPLALFTATVEIAHASPSYFIQEPLKQRV
jgi:hypothetical protein